MRRRPRIEQVGRWVSLSLNLMTIVLLLDGPLGQTGILSNLHDGSIRNVAAAWSDPETTELAPALAESRDDGIDNNEDG